MTHEDTIRLQLTHVCIVGILDHERVSTQRVVVALSLGVDIEHTGASGTLGTSVDYARVDQIVRFLLSEAHFRLLESAGLAIADALLTAFPAAKFVDIELSKPDILDDATPTVAMRRDRAWIGRRAERAHDVVSLPEVTIRIEDEDLSSSEDHFSLRGPLGLRVARALSPQRARDRFV